MKAGLLELMALPVFDLLDIAKEVEEAYGSVERNGTRHKNRG